MAIYKAASAYGTYSRAGLMWSEYLFLIGAAIAAFVAVDRYLWNVPEIAGVPELKHLALFVTIPALIVTLSGRRLNQYSASPVLSRAVVAAWPLGALALLIVSGSVYARVVDDIRETLLAIGLYMFMAFVSAAMVLASKSPESLIRGYFRILMVAALVMSVSLVINYRVNQVYHVEIFLVVPLAVYCALVFRNPWLRIGGVMFFLSMAVFSAKNTGYLIALMTFLYLGYGFWLPRLRRTDPLNRVSGYYLIFVIVLLIAAGVLFLLAFREAHLPEGSSKFRLWMYEQAWQRFLDSPLWGTLFAERSVEKFPLYAIEEAGGILNTHSDILDLLAHGGIIGIGLWLYGLFRVARAGNRTLLTPTTYDHPWTPYAHTFAVLSLAGVIAYAVNPVLVSPGMAYLLWTNLGFLLGLSLRPEAIPASAAPVKQSLAPYRFKRQGGLS